MPSGLGAVELLSRHDLEVLGTGLSQLFCVVDDGAFAELIRSLEKVEAVSERSAATFEPKD